MDIVKKALNNNIKWLENIRDDNTWVISVRLKAAEQIQHTLESFQYTEDLIKMKGDIENRTEDRKNKD